MVKIRPDEISSIIKQQIEQYQQEVKAVNIGTVFQVGDGIARIYGLEKAMAGELLEFEDGTLGIALNLEANNVGAVLLGGGLKITEGSRVRCTGKIAEIPVGENYLGRVVDALARPVDGKGAISTTESRLTITGQPFSTEFTSTNKLILTPYFLSQSSTRTNSTVCSVTARTK